MTTVEETHQRYSDTDAVLEALGLHVTHKVLFVSTEPVLNRSFKRTVSKCAENFNIHFAESFAEAAQMIQQENYSLVISAEHLDHASGSNLLAEVKTVNPDTNRILLSSNSSVEATIDAFNKAGLYSVIMLPWVPDELRQLIERSCKDYALQHENVVLSKLIDDEANELTSIVAQLENTVQMRTASLLTGLIAALDLRDTETQGHSRRVALYSKRLAMELGVTASELTSIERGALLHDIGKIGVSDTILLKPGKLNDEEWEEMRKHAQKGYQILENIPFLGDARFIVHQHHERFDGNGYPQKLRGKDIVIGARIFAIIDTYDAMTSDRPYRKGLPHDVAIKEINKCTGSQFDPDIVEAWNRIPETELKHLRDRAQTDIFAGAI